MGVARVVRVRLVRNGAPLRWLGCFGFVWFVRVCRWGYWVPSGSSSLSGCALCVAGFFCAHLVCSGAPWGSSRFVLFVQMRHGGRWVRSCSLGCALEVTGFFRVHFINAGGPWRSLGSLGFVWFVLVRHRFRWGRSGSSCS